MQARHRKFATSAAIAVVSVVLLAAGVAAFVRAGLYDIGADDPHYPLTYSALAQLRDASIRRRAAQLAVPDDLASPARIRQGAGNYDAMCTGCHRAPGMGPTELSQGLYPAPPDLSRTPVETARAFWTIKHGIKASGMPAWGRSMSDEYIWNLATFVQQLPRMDAAGYRTMVARSGGHEHGGGETDGMPGTAHEHHHDDAGNAAASPAAGHEHPPGTPPHVDPPTAHVDPPGAAAHDHAAPPRHSDP
ncbi:c-type cytochrome [Lysobacter xanthus]